VVCIYVAVGQKASTVAAVVEALKKNGRGLIEVRRIDAAKEIAGNLSQSRNVVYM
jgi:prohibitin 1